MATYEKVKVEAPLMQWAQQDDVRKSLLKIYRKTDDIYDGRLDEKKKKISYITELLEELNSSSFSEDTKLRAVCKANALLRRGQIKADALDDPLTDYQTACAILTPLRDRRAEDKGPMDLPDFLVRLNLGKFFRNMGMYLHRYDYHERALSEFSELLNELGCGDADWSGTLWKTYIWLEAAMNLSRTELHLYQIQKAKAHLWMISTAVSKVYKAEAPEGLSISYEELLVNLFPKVTDSGDFDCVKNYAPVEDLIHFQELGNKLEPLKDSVENGCKSGSDMLKGYSIQTLLQLGIAYRKNRDYSIARRFFSYILVMYPTIKATSGIHYNVDALNNYAVCLRKGGFKASCDILDKNALPEKYSSEPNSPDPAEAYFLSSTMFDTPQKSKNICSRFRLALSKPSKAAEESVPTPIHLLPTTMKRMYYAILVSLCEGTCTASSIFKKWDTDKFWAQDVLKLTKQEDGKLSLTIHNRFAMLEMIRSFYRKSESRQDDLKVVEEWIGKLLELNPGDREIRLLQGQLLQRQLLLQPEKAAEGVKILNDLYREAPQLSRGTIGLKAYQTMGYIFLAQKQYSQAKSIFHKIQDANPRNLTAPDHSEDGALVQKLLLADLPQADVVSAVDEGWCLMKMGEYSAARVIFEEILKIYEAQDPDHGPKTTQPVARLGIYSETRIRNNLIECLLEEHHQMRKDQDGAADRSSGEAGKSKALRKNPQQSLSSLSSEIQKHLGRLKAIEPNNPIAARHQGYWNLAQDDYLSAMTDFETATANRYDDIYAHAGWVLAAYECFTDKEYKAKRYIQQKVRKRLQFISGPYGLQSCGKLSQMAEIMAAQLEQEINQLAAEILPLKESIEEKRLFPSACIPYAENQKKKWEDLENKLKEKQEERNMLYASIARINLGVLEEGYSLFDDLKDNNKFSSLPLEQQGNLLAILYQLYAKVQTFKNDHLYCPENDEDYVTLVQYRTIGHLKRYLKPKTEKEPGGRLSLWNTAYMNDDREGRCFLTVFKELTEEDPTLSSFPIGSYFSQKELSGAGIPGTSKKEAAGANQEDPSTFLYENIYTSSLSLEKDSIPMWISYADNANGCTISYSKDYLNLRKKRAMPTDVSLYSENEFPLYEVIYLNDSKNNDSKIDITKHNKNKAAVTDLWKNICCLLLQLQKVQACNDFKKDLITVINGFVRACLSEVRFLVKNSEYAYEQEIRMIHYSKDHLLETEHSEIPRLYISLDREVHLKKVVLGPKVTPYAQDQLETWLMNTGKVDAVKHSERHIR